VHCLRLLHEGTATALGYGFFRNARKEFASGPQRVLFVDTGYSHTTATVVTFEEGTAKVDAVAWDEEAGGRNMDAVVGRLLAAKFQDKHKAAGDPWQDKKVRLKLLTAAEKVRKTMTPYGVNQAKANSECLVDDYDLAETVQLEEMEAALQPVVDRITGVVKRALAQVGASDLEKPVEAFAGVEIVGGASRVRMVKRAVALSMGMEIDEPNAHGLQTSTNADECVAKGCALCCAMVSPLFRVQEYKVVDRVVLPVRLRWGPVGQLSATPSDVDGGEDEKQAVMVFPVGSPMPNTQRVTFREAGSFEVVAEYDPKEVAKALRAGAGVGSATGAATGGGGEESAGSAVDVADSAAASQLLVLKDLQVAKFRIDVPQAEVDEAVANQKALDEMDGVTNGASASDSTGDADAAASNEFLPKIRVEFGLNDHGLVTVDAASLAKPKVPETPVAAPAAAPTTEAAATPAGTDADAKPSEEAGATPASDEAKAEGEATPASEGEGQGETKAEGQAPMADGEATPEGDGAAAPTPAPAAPAMDAAPRKRKVTRVPIGTSTERVTGALDAAAFTAVQAEEAAMAKIDEAVRMKTSKRNELEKYVYALRGDIKGKLSSFVEGDKASEINDLLDEEEDWVCYGEGEDAELPELEEHLAKLHSFGKPIEARWYNAQHITDAGATLMSLVERYRAVAASADEAYAHLEESERDILRSASKGAESWFRDLQGAQGKLPQTEDPVLKVADVRTRAQAIQGECERIVNKPKPKPQPVDEPKAPVEPAAEAAPAAADSDVAATATEEQKEGEDVPAADAASKPAEGDAAEKTAEEGQAKMEGDDAKEEGNAAATEEAKEQ